MLGEEGLKKLGGEALKNARYEERALKKLTANYKHALFHLPQLKGCEPVVASWCGGRR
jgi:hypothetical protein